tara:strand:- start:3328 stop:4719 length:1392 start_codon:yes stop_codon:yes gene_type:complete
MLYKSTRGASPEIPFSEVLLSGLAPDGGLYIPISLPFYDVDHIDTFKDLSYSSLASKVLFPFVEEEIEEKEFQKLVEDSYSIFEDEEVVKLVSLRENLSLLELFHGPTLAFKDVAMQLLGTLLNHFSEKNNSKIAVLGATSGDTGSAAIAACSRYKNVDIFILYPNGMVTDIQRKQMTTSGSSNVHALAIDTDFDGCQEIVKALFLDKNINDSNTKLIAANSINWTRCMTQCVYFFWAYLKLKYKVDKPTFSIPSGNFGHAYAGWLAKKMGLPIERLLIATNKNDVLHKMLTENVYSKSQVHRTLAPSMDISIASNFERLLYNLFDDNSNKVKNLMNSFPARDVSLPDKELATLRSFFSSYSSSDSEIIGEIRSIYHSNNILLDPHTATGTRTANQISRTDEHVVSMATAHPAKFIEAINQSLPGLAIDDVHQLKGIEEQKESFITIPNDLIKVREYIKNNLS